MTKPKFFFADEVDPEFCYTLESIKDQILLDRKDLDETILIQAKVDTGNGFYYCREFQAVGESGDGCGIQCKEYSPRNGKNGRCRHHANTYTHGDKKFLLSVIRKDGKNKFKLKELK